MARFDVYRPEGAHGYLLDCQADFLDELGTRVAVPLLPPEAGSPVIRRLNPAFEVDGKRVVMFTQYMTSVTTRQLGFRLSSLAGQHTTIMNALDMLLTGLSAA